MRLSLRRVPEVDVDANFLAIESAFSGTVQTAGSSTVTLPTAGSFLIVDDMGAPVFRVDDDGTVHIRTASLVLADL